MKPIGIFYGSTHGMTAKAANKIKIAFDSADVTVYNLRDTSIEDIARYDNLIFGTSSWGIGEMQDEWEVFIDKLSEIDFTNKKVALFALGDQKEYPESFVDALGTLYCRLPDKKCVVGAWPTEGYNFFFSLAEKDGKFVGLALDEHSQPKLSIERINEWVEQLKKELV